MYEFSLTSEECEQIQEVLRMRGEDYVTIKAESQRLSFSKTSNQDFKYVEHIKPILGDFAVRVLDEALVQLIHPGYFRLEITDKSIKFTNYTTPDNAVADLPHLKAEIPNTASNLALSSSQTDLAMNYVKANESMDVAGMYHLMRINKLTKVSKTGVVIKDSNVYINGGWFRVISEMPFNQLNVVLPFENLDSLTKYIRKFKKDEMQLWHYDNYLITNVGGMYYGFRIGAREELRDTEQLLSLVPDHTFKCNLAGVVKVIKNLKITKASNFSTKWSPRRQIYFQSEPNRGSMLVPLDADNATDVVDFELDLEQMKETLPLLLENTDGKATVNIYGHTVSFTNQFNITLYLNMVVKQL